MSYEEYSVALMTEGYFPLGAYEHCVKKDRENLLFRWMHVSRKNLIAEVCTDELGNPHRVIAVYEEQ